MKNKLTNLFEDHEIGVAVILSILLVLFTLGVAFGTACLWGWVFMLVWNNLLPLLWSDAPTIGFWLSVGIVYVVRLLFKSTVTVNNNRD
jgi:hypothetical protein